MGNEWKALFDALGNYKAQTGEYPQKIHVRVEFAHAAKAENAYRKLRQEKRVEARTMPELKLADDRKEWVDAETADQRMERDIAAEMLKTYPEEARNIRQVMSYKQSEMKAAGGLE